MPKGTPVELNGESIREMYVTQRMSINKIAQTLGSSFKTIANKLAEQGIVEHKRQNIVELPKDELERLYVNENMTMGSIAEIYKCNETTVRKYLIRYGLHGKGVHKHGPYTDFQTYEPRIRELAEQGKTNAEIAEDIGVALNTFRRWMVFFNIKSPIRRVKIDVDELRRLYCEEKWTSAQIAAKYKVHYSTVRTQLVAAGIALTRPEIAQRMSERYANVRKPLLAQGYMRMFLKGHPSANREGYIEVHRLEIEKHIGRYVQKGEEVHHINFKRADNRIENLALMASGKDHKGFHHWLEKRYAWIEGFTDEDPGPFVFDKPCFWAGQWITQYVPKFQKRDSLADLLKAAVYAEPPRQVVH